MKKSLLTTVIAAVCISALAQPVKTGILVEPPQGIYMAAYEMSNNITSNVESEDPNVPWSQITTLDWRDTTGVEVDGNLFGGLGQYIGSGTLLDMFYWPVVSWPQWESSGVTWWGWDFTNAVGSYSYYGGGDIITNYLGAVVTNSTDTGSSLVNEHCDMYYSYPEWSPYFYNIRRTADAEMKLATGGPLGSTQKNLWVISASATAYTNLLDTQGHAVPFNQISIGSFGNLGNDGDLYVVLPDNSPPIDVTPRVKSNDFYMFNVTQQEYKLRIVVNANDVNGNNISNPLFTDHVPSYNTYCVGQYLSFSAEFSPAVPGLVSANPTWILPGTYVNNQVQNSAGCEVYNISPVLANQNPTPAWYYDGGSNLTVSAGLNCAFANGQNAYTYTHGMFNVYRPYLVPLSDFSSGSFRVKLKGLYYSVQLYPGVVFNITARSSYSGMAGITQVYDDHQSSPRSIGNAVLDGQEFYPYPSEDPDPVDVIANNPNNSLTLIDTPEEGNIATGSASLIMQVTDYVRYKPSGSPSSNIYVTLGEINWQVSASETFGVLGEVNQLTPYLRSLTPTNDFPFWTKVGPKGGSH